MGRIKAAARRWQIIRRGLRPQPRTVVVVITADTEQLRRALLRAQHRSLFYTHGDPTSVTP